MMQRDLFDSLQVTGENTHSGCRAVGLSLAAKVSQTSDVVAITRNPTPSIIAREGFLISNAWGEETASFFCMCGASLDKDSDYVVITTKSYDTESAGNKRT